jgi:hypothetical protein
MAGCQVGLARIKCMTATLSTRIRGHRYVLQPERTGVGTIVWTAEAESGPLNYPADLMTVALTLGDVLTVLTRPNGADSGPKTRAGGHLEGMIGQRTSKNRSD